MTRDPDSQSPSWSLGVERSVVGSLILHPEWSDDVVGLCQGSDFGDLRLGKIYSAVASLVERDGDVDYADLAGRLGIGHSGMAGVFDLTESAAPTRTRAVAHANTVKRMAAVRRLTEEAAAVIEDAGRSGSDPAEFLACAGDRLAPLFEVDATGGPRTLRGKMHAILAEAAKGKMLGTPTGYTDLDRIFSLAKGSVTAIGARPAMGKSAFVLGMLLKLARAGHPCLMFSLEMDEVDQALRATSTLSGVPYDTIVGGKVDSFTGERLARAAMELERLPLAFDDGSGVTISDIRVRSRAFKREHRGLEKPVVIAVDYLQLVTPIKATGNRNTDIGEISRGFKKLMRELNGFGFVLSQLSREMLKRNPPRPNMADLRESGDIEADCDNVIMLWRPEKYDANTEHRHLAEIIVDKQRRGPTGAAWLAFNGPTTTFSNRERNT